MNKESAKNGNIPMKLSMVIYEALGYEFPADQFCTPDADKMRDFYRVIAEIGVEIADYK